MLLNSSVKQTVKVYLDDDDENNLCYSRTETGQNYDNRGSQIATSGPTGKVYVKVFADGKACQAKSQPISVPQSQGSYLGIVAAYNGHDGDSQYDDAYVLLTWKQPQSS